MWNFEFIKGVKIKLYYFVNNSTKAPKKRYRPTNIPITSLFELSI